MLEQIPINDNGEPLVDLRRHCPEIRVEARYTWPRQPTLWARTGVADRLNVAQELLAEAQPGYRLLVVDAWRSLGRQRLFYRLALISVRLLRPLWPAARVRDFAGRYVAAPNASFPPPHSTGGAIDVRLLGPDGNPVSMGPRGVESARTAYNRLSPAEARNRSILCTAMVAAGFANYEEEWWHWSYGDSIWALKSGKPYACYGSMICLTTISLPG
jgi:D-alanyl-D-alanine dipeptidase